MKKHIGIFIAGAIVVVPLAITAYLIWSASVWLDQTGSRVLQTVWPTHAVPAGVGAAVLVAFIYTVGRLTHLWVFRALLAKLELLLTRVPGVKVIYESVRDLMRLLGSGSEMGRVVQYNVPGSGVSMLGILTNQPDADDPGGKVAVFFPFSYMFGGPTIYVSPKDVQPLNMSVEKALRLAATAHMGFTKAKMGKGE